MAIKIKSLQTDKLSEDALKKDYLYKDVKFDLELAYSFNSQLNRRVFQNDVQALFDVEAIQNSISNAFLTTPGQKILNPRFGIDLRRFLFEPVDDFTAQIIQDDIETKLPLMEPRITVENVTVEGDEDNQQYNISLQINVPSLDIKGLTIKNTLKSNGYVES
jgi:phage baseplate assembly protein W